MKTKLLLSTFLCLLFANAIAQDKTTVSATSSDISDNLDLRAVASIFGDSKDLEDFEYRLNNPKAAISNLDLNDDFQVDYLRVIESIEGNIHLIIIQAVLGQDQFQDVATVELEKDNNNRTHIQVVGDVYMYGNNYIYEPVYNFVPIIYNYIWISNYRPYYSPWYWGYYPRHFYVWKPYSIIQSRNQGYSNRYELNRSRSVRDVTYGSNPKSSVYSRPRTISNPNTTQPDPIIIGDIPVYNSNNTRSGSTREINSGNSNTRNSGGVRATSGGRR